MGPIGKQLLLGSVAFFLYIFFLSLISYKTFDHDLCSSSFSCYLCSSSFSCFFPRDIRWGRLASSCCWARSRRRVFIYLCFSHIIQLSTMISFLLQSPVSFPGTSGWANWQAAATRVGHDAERAHLGARIGTQRASRARSLLRWRQGAVPA